MLTEAERNTITAIFERVDGGSCTDFMQMIDEAIDDGEITQELFDDNEMEIAGIFDNGWFTCNQCGWTMPIGDMADNDDWQCQQCADEADD